MTAAYLAPPGVFPRPGTALRSGATRSPCIYRSAARISLPSGPPASTAELVGRVVDQLLQEGVEPADIGVVSLRGQSAGDAVHRAKSLGRHAFAHADADDMADRLVADSFLRWKGLERPVVVIADVSEGVSEFGTRLHIALTRALTAAIVVAPSGCTSSWYPAG